MLVVRNTFLEAREESPPLDMEARCRTKSTGLVMRQPVEFDDFDEAVLDEESLEQQQRDYPARQKCHSSSSLTSLVTMAMEDWENYDYCMDHSPCEDSSKWQAETCNLPLEVARMRVMEDFPSMFRPDSHWGDRGLDAEVSLEGVVVKDAMLNRAWIAATLQDWDFEGFCGGHCAEDRARLLVAETCDLTLDMARLRVMEEFPSTFSSLLRYSGVPGELSLEELAVEKGLHSINLRLCPEDWDPEEFCMGNTADARAKWVMQACGLSLEQAQLCVMNLFPAQFGRRSGRKAMTYMVVEVDRDMKNRLSNSAHNIICAEEWVTEEASHGPTVEDAAASAAGVPKPRGRCRGRQARIARRAWAAAAQQEAINVEEQSCQYVATPAARDFARHVPKVLNFAEEFSKTSVEAPPTTLMLRNIPNRYTQPELIEELEEIGFQGSFDFVYLPIDFGSMGNVGYAFINFDSTTWATRCQEDLAGYVFRKYQHKTRTKAMTVSVAHLQGLQANLQHYEKTAMTRGASSKRGCPVILGCGEQGGSIPTAAVAALVGR